MTEKYFNDLVEHEINWLRYYSMRDSRNELTDDIENIYDFLVPIGYTKRVIELSKRCSAGTILYKEGMIIKDFEVLHEPKNEKENKFSALQVKWILDKENRKSIIDKLK
jgi:hypothetical protein